MLDRNRFENSRPDGFPVLEIVPEKEGEGPRLFVPLRRTELGGRVVGPLADLALSQVFSFSREDYDRPIEALYRFPLPGDAAVTGVTVRFGEVEVLAELKERTQAEEEYAQAKREGRQAALTTRESPDVFTLRVSGIQPDQDVIVETRYVQLASPEGIGWSLRIPLTTAPRYVRQDEAESRLAHGQPLALLRDPGHRFALNVVVEGAERVSSRTHDVESSGDGGALRVRLRDGDVLGDRDCVLHWTPARTSERAAVSVVTHRDPASDHVYFLAQVTPSSKRSEQPSPAREITLVVDRSGSMEGAKWAAADWAVKRFLWGLSEADTFNLCLFHSSTRWLSGDFLPGDSAHVDRAVKFLERHRDSGGTELGVALEQALHLPRTAGERSRHVLLVTDAEVSDAGRILRLAHDEYVRPERRRISVLCIDAAPNALLATQLAEAGGGVARFLTSSPEEGDISTALDEILEDWSAPELTDLKLEFDRAGVQASHRRTGSSAKAGWSAVDLGDLPEGRSVWVAGRAPVGTRGELAYRLTAGNREIAFGSIDGPAADHPAIKPLFGARRITALENLAHGYYDREALSEELFSLGYDSNQVLHKKAWFNLYAENAAKATREALKELLVRESLEFGIASSEAAFVATRTEKGQKARTSVVVANALPGEWPERFVGGMAAAPVMVAACRMAPGTGGRSRLRPLSAMNPTAGGGGDAMADLKEAVAQYGSMGDAAGDDDALYFANSPAYEFRDALPGPAVAGRSSGTRVFAGAPVFRQGMAVLLDETATPDAGIPLGRVTLTELRIVFPQAAPAGDPGRGLALLVYVEDMGQPRARIRLADLARQGWRRPLNVLRTPGQAIRIVLDDPDGAWADSAPAMEVYLTW
jgi:Ca-activated chloride channel homolog